MTATATEAETPPSGGKPPGPRYWRWLLAGALVLGLTAGAALLLLGDGEQGDDEPAPAPTTIALPKATGPPLDAAGSELVRLLEAGRARTFHAVYRTSSAADESGELTIELWRRDGRQRQDTALKLPDGGVVRTAGLALGDRTIVCSQRPTQDWRCSQTIGRDVDPDGVFGSARDQLRGVDVRARADTVADRAVRCFDFTAADGPGTFCVTPEGVPVRATVGTSEIVLTSLSGEVPASVFDPPARPVGAAGEG